ncbi:MAG TPA: hypothetical protein VNQ77_10880 [Frankiaceae bacterium]|nr:hypothetical protein [Frankiaceae bacterium]
MAAQRIDLAHPASWPDRLREVTTALAAQVETLLDGTGVHASELAAVNRSFAAAAEAQTRAAIGTHLIGAMHATRLLPHEATSIRRDGLSMLTDEMRDGKLAAAATAYPHLLDDAGADLLRRSSPLVWQGGGVRRGLLWVVVPFDVEDGDVSGLTPLMDRWGGEVINWTHHPSDGDRAAGLVEALSAVSRPTLVELGVTVDQIPEFGCVWWVAVGRLLGLPGAGTEWGLTSAVPGANIGEFVTPDHPRWPAVIDRDDVGGDPGS